MFGDEDSVDVIRETAFLAHARDRDPLGLFSLYGTTANAADGIEYDQPVDCIFQHGMDGALTGHECGPAAGFDTPGIALTSSCADPDVTMFSAWAINPEVALFEFEFSDGSNQGLEPNRGYLIWAWENTKRLTDLRVEDATQEVERAVADFVNTFPHDPCN